MTYDEGSLGLLWVLLIGFPFACLSLLDLLQLALRLWKQAASRPDPLTNSDFLP